jgi:hypothetical protein
VLYEEFWDSQVPDYVEGWVGWNWAFGTPAYSIVMDSSAPRTCYYPVVWNGGIFQLFGTNHPLFLNDNNSIGLMPGGLSANLKTAPFKCGFKVGQ